MNTAQRTQLQWDIQECQDILADVDTVYYRVTWYSAISMKSRLQFFAIINNEIVWVTKRVMFALNASRKLNRIKYSYRYNDSRYNGGMEVFALQRGADIIKELNATLARHDKPLRCQEMY